MQNANYARTDSAYSTAKDVGAGATGAGAGAGAAVAYDNPFSNNAAASGPQMSQINGPRPQSNAMAYQNIPSEQYWAGDNANGTGAGGSGAFEAASKSKKKWWIIGGVVAAIVIIAAVVGGVVGSQKSKSGSSGGNSSSGAGNSGTGNAANTDASNFDKDPRLHQSFWGFAYTPQVCLLVFDVSAVNANGRDRFLRCVAQLRATSLATSKYVHANISDTRPR